MWVLVKPKLWYIKSQVLFWAPYWLTLVFPCYLSVAMVKSLLRPRTSEEQLLFTHNSPLLCPQLFLDNLPFLLQILNHCCQTVLSLKDMCSLLPGSSVCKCLLLLMIISCWSCLHTDWHTIYLVFKCYFCQLLFFFAFTLIARLASCCLELLSNFKTMINF